MENSSTDDVQVTQIKRQMIQNSNLYLTLIEVCPDDQRLSSFVTRII